MTLGKKLSNYRKIAGLTQQQLAEHLNVSAQAVSKWENDMSEPDLATLRALARLYNTSVDDLLDMEKENNQSSQVIDAEAVANSVFSKIGEQIKNDPQPIGYCKECGIAVTEENLAEKDPVILCKKCKGKRIAEEKARIEAEENRKLELSALAERKKKQDMDSMRHHRNKSLIWAGIAAIPLLIICIVNIFSDISSADTWSGVLGIIILDYAIFSFVFIMFYDTFIKDAVLYMFTASVNWPGLIFTFDLDGLIWLIAMKLLFAVLGFIIGVLAAMAGLIFGLIASMIAFPFVLLNYMRKIAMGIYEDPALE
jgi:transcriptional regulator with XRE-family HTH domain